DWSSDVCSSDLRCAAGGPVPHRGSEGYIGDKGNHPGDGEQTAVAGADEHAVENEDPACDGHDGAAHHQRPGGGVLDLWIRGEKRSDEEADPGEGDSDDCSTEDTPPQRTIGVAAYHFRVAGTEARADEGLRSNRQCVEGEGRETPQGVDDLVRRERNVPERR